MKIQVVTDYPIDATIATALNRIAGFNLFTHIDTNISLNIKVLSIVEKKEIEDKIYYVTLLELEYEHPDFTNIIYLEYLTYDDLMYECLSNINNFTAKDYIEHLKTAITSITAADINILTSKSYLL